jgi:hypothetical protein
MLMTLIFHPLRLWVQLLLVIPFLLTAGMLLVQAVTKVGSLGALLLTSLLMGVASEEGIRLESAQS